jgi:hypothetical protein
MRSEQHHVTFSHSGLCEPRRHPGSARRAVQLEHDEISTRLISPGNDATTEKQVLGEQGQLVLLQEAVAEGDAQASARLTGVILELSHAVPCREHQIIIDQHSGAGGRRWLVRKGLVRTHALGLLQGQSVQPKLSRALKNEAVTCAQCHRALSQDLSSGRRHISELDAVVRTDHDCLEALA